MQALAGQGGMKWSLWRSLLLLLFLSVFVPSEAKKKKTKPPKKALLVSLPWRGHVNPLR